MANSSKKTALITGVTGQDGAYLAHLLLEKRRSSSFNTGRIEESTRTRTLKTNASTCTMAT